jgi:hypothetical protein
LENLAMTYNKCSNLPIFSGILGVFLFLLAACSAPAPAAAPASTTVPTPPPGAFYINPNVDQGQINPMVYGVNHGPWAVITEKTLPLAKDAGITLIRVPGGNWGDENDLQPYHIDGFAQLAKQMGAEVSINARLFNGSPEKAAELVQYTNVEKEYGVRYWGIGNEPTLFATSRAAPEYGVEQFNREWRAIAEAMKAVDPSIVLIGPELHQFGSDLASTPKDPFGMDWMTEFLKANGDLVDIVSIHRYPFPQGRGGRAATIEELAATSAEWDRILPYLHQLILDTTGREIPVAITEVNSHWSNAVGGEATPDSFYNAIWWADVLGRMISQRVAMVNYFSLQSNPSTGGYGLFSRSDPRPTYYTYKMYQMFGTQLVQAVSPDDQVGVYAARRADGTLTILFVNLSSESVQKPLVVQGLDPVNAEIWRFDQTSKAELIGEEAFSSGAEISLPPQSITLLVVK